MIQDPKNPADAALKINLLAFRESLGEKSLLGGDDPRKALAALSPELQANPFLLRAKAHVFLLDNKTAAAQALLKTFLKDHPEDAIALYLRGVSLRDQPSPDLAAAAKDLENASTLQPDFVRAYWDLAAIYRKLGRYDEALDRYNRVLAKSPDRKGTPEAMEETAKEKGKSGKTISPLTSSEPETSIAVPEAPATEATPVGIAATGADISANILEAIQETSASIGAQNYRPSQPGPVPNRPPALPPEERVPPEER